MIGMLIDPETLETIYEIAIDERPFFTTLISDYNVTEGLLLMLIIALVCKFLWDEIRRLF